MNEYKGVHCIYDFVNIRCDDLLHYQQQINVILDQVIAESNLNQIDQSSQLFNGQDTPPGFANVRVLDESHLEIPEQFLKIYKPNKKLRIFKTLKLCLNNPSIVIFFFKIGISFLKAYFVLRKISKLIFEGKKIS